jgi:hypothetical protein
VVLSSPSLSLSPCLLVCPLTLPLPPSTGCRESPPLPPPLPLSLSLSPCLARADVTGSPRCGVATAGEVAGLEEALEIPICGAQDLAMVLTSVAQDKERYGVLVDFSAPDAVMENYKQAIAFGIRPIIGAPSSL